MPHIFVRTTHDLFYLQGYVTAQDRLFQLDLLRRAGRGELAAAIGPAGAASDAFAIARGLAGEAEGDRSRLGAVALAAAQAYAAGINKFLEQHGESLPLEFTILGFRPAPWTVGDTLVIQRLLALERTGASPLGRVIAAGGTDAGSSCRAVTGARSPSGHPFLEGDPRLAGNADPALWYAVGLTGPDDALAGLAAPGIPGIAIGHNGTAAWSFIAAADASLLGDLDASLAIGRARDAATFAGAIAAARRPTPSYCYADAAGHIGLVSGAGAMFDPAGGEARQIRPAAESAPSPALSFRHPLEPLLPGGIGRLLSSGPYPPVGGVLERIRVDLADPDGMRLGLPIGESGQPASRHHGDQTAAWRSSELPVLALSRSRIGTPEGTLVLRPR